MGTSPESISELRSLVRSEERYRAFVQLSSEGIWCFELQEPVPVSLPEDEQIALFYRCGYLSECNDALARMYGLPSSEAMIGARLAQFLIPEDPANQEYLRAFIRSGYRLEGGESRERDAHGEFRVFLNNLTGVVEDGLLRRAWGTQRDVTDQKLAEEALRTSEQRFDLATRAAGIGTFDWDIVTGQVIWSEQEERLFGLEPGSFEGTIADWERRLAPEDAHQVRSILTQAISERAPEIGFSFRIVRADGALRWLEGSARFLYGGDGTPTRMVGVNRDVTERRRALLALEESEEQFRTLANALPALVWICKPDGWLLFLNQRWSDYTGQTEEQFQGFGWSETIHPDDQATVLTLWEKATLTGGNYQGECRYRRHDGQYRWHYFQGVSLYAADGTIKAWYGASIDIHDRKVAEDALRESESRFKNMADNAPAMIWITEADGECVFLSQAWYDFTGQSPQTGLGLGWIQAVHPDDREEAAREFILATEDHRPFRLEYRLRRSDGVYRWAIDAASPRIAPDGEFLGFVGSVIDIDERRGMEQALRLADRRKDEFLAMLAHELRNPLAPIVNAAEIIREVATQSDVPPIVKRQRDTIDRNARRLSRLVDDLLEVSRISEGKIELRRERVEILPLIDEAVNSTQSHFDSRAQELSVSVPRDPVFLQADPMRIVQILVNLLTNASKYTPEGGRVSLMAEVDGAEAILTVRDNGRGIDPELMPHIFEVFVQGKQGLARTDGGLGIGLSLVRRLVEMHGGSVTAFSAGAGRGSEFRVCLPVEPSTRRVRMDAQPATQATSQRGCRVLIVEDNPDAAETLAELVELWGHDHRILHEGAKAVVTAAEFEPHCVLLDIGLPDQSGHEIARALKQANLPTRPLLVALTGYGDETHRRLAQEAGFDEYLTKPVDPERLRAVLSGVCDPPSSSC